MAKAKGQPETNTTPKKSDWKSEFCRLLADTMCVATAARGVGKDRTACYGARRRDPAFAQAWDDAKSEAIENLEKVAYERAKSMSDTLVIFLLKSHKPSVYRDRIETTNANYAINYDNLTDDQLQRLANGEHPASVLSAQRDK